MGAGEGDRSGKVENAHDEHEAADDNFPLRVENEQEKEADVLYANVHLTEGEGIEVEGREGEGDIAEGGYVQWDSFVRQ